jgi:hypothetical protein
MNKIVLLLIGSLWITFPAQAQTFVNARFGTSQVRLVIPKGYCVIDRNDSLGSLHYKMQADGNKGRNSVALLFADCGEWAKRKADNSYLLRHHGNYLFQLTNSQELLLPETTTRADLIQIYTDYELKSAGVRQENLTKFLEEKLKTGSVKGSSLNSQVNFGMIDKNSLAFFSGSGATLRYPNEVLRINGVTAATLTRQVPISINLYGSDGGQRPFDGLLAQQKDLVRLLISVNE